jgi:RNA polymerase sigma-70 factor, ECF subfamily
LSNIAEPNYSRMEEHAIIDKLKAGDDEAFRMIVGKYQKLVLNCAFKFLRNKVSAEDLTQEVFLEVFESIHSFRADSQLSTWIYRIAVTKALNKLKSLQRKKRLGVLSSLLGAGDVGAQIASPEDERPDVELENRERKNILNWALQELPDNQRIAFTLSKVEGMSYEEISSVMNTSLPSVESLIHRAKGNLKKKLYGYYKNQVS